MRAPLLLVGHFARRPDHLRDVRFVNHGLQLWTALPLEQEEVEPSFAHTPADAIPTVVQDGVTLRVLIGTAFGVPSVFWINSVLMAAQGWWTKRSTPGPS